MSLINSSSVIDSVTIDTSNKDVTAKISYGKDKCQWKLQLIYKEAPQFPIHPSKEPITEIKDSRDKKIVDHLVRICDIDKGEATNLLHDIMGEAGQREGELKYLIYGGADEEQDEDNNIPEDEAHFTDEERHQAQSKALEILKTKDPLMFATDVIQTIHTGDKNNIKIMLVSIANQSCLNSNGLQVKFNGDSGSGKTHLVSSTLHVMPQEYVFDTKLSDKALYRIKNLPDGCIIFSDDTHMSEALEEIIKEAMSKFQKRIRYTVIVNDEVKIFEGPKRMMMLLTSVEDRSSAETRDRVFLLNPESSEQQHKNVWDHSTTNLKNGEDSSILVDFKTLVCREMFRIIKQQTFNVVIPAEIVDNAVCTDKSKFRTINKFWDLVKGLTILNFAQRKTNDKGYLIATKEDFYNAKRLFESQLTNIMTKLDAKEQQIMKAIVYRGGTDGLTVSEISKHAGISYGTVNDRIKGKVNKEGLLDRVEDLESWKREGSKEILFRCKNIFNYGTEFIYLKGEKRELPDW